MARVTGETFNKEGKTDIIVKWRDKNLFIAECKRWKGPESLREALDQLLGKYALWRDTKTAILLFSERKDFGRVVKQIPDVVSGHINFVRRDASYQHRAHSRYILHHTGEEERLLILTVLAFNLPSQEEEEPSPQGDSV
jgi:hypothetical protein